MASPRVFVSSTCYDLADERDGLASFCNAFGFDAVLSERGDVFYHPDLHTHESCVREVSACQLFILVIGGRFGGKYAVDKTKSVTNAEYAAARELGIPVFALVKQDVLSDHNLWQRNRSQTFANEIEYPSIEKREHAPDIFSFIDQVRLAPTNNGLFGFRLTRDIFEFLRKQWASMFFEYLQSRSISRQVATTNETLASLAAASSKIEDIVKSIYRNVDKVGADSSISAINLDSRAKELFFTMAARTGDRQFLHSAEPDEIVEIAKRASSEWTEFFVQNGFFALVNQNEGDGTPSILFAYELGDIVIAKLTGKLTKMQQVELSYFGELYQSFLKLPIASRARLIASYVFTPTPEGEETEKAGSVPITGTV
jgi:hypothetical protein